MAYFNYGAEKDTLKWHLKHVSNILLRGTPKVRWRMKKTPLFFKENVDDAVWLKNTPFRRFFCLDTGACVASQGLKGPGGFRVFDGLSCYLSLIF